MESVSEAGAKPVALAPGAGGAGGGGLLSLLGGVQETARGASSDRRAQNSTLFHIHSPAAAGAKPQWRISRVEIANPFRGPSGAPSVYHISTYLHIPN